MDFGCLEDHTKFFDGCGLDITNHQGTMVYKMSPKIIIEGLVLKDINEMD